MAEEQILAGLNPETDMEEGSPLADDFNFEIIDARFIMWDYNGKQPQAVPAGQITFKTDKYPEPVVQAYKAGNHGDWRPTDDGESLIRTGREKKLRVNSNLGVFLQVLVVERGFPGTKLGNKLSPLIGLKGHAERIPAPNREGLEKQKSASGKEIDPTILVVTEITEMPDDSKKGSKKGKAGKAASSDLTTLATDLLVQLLKANDGGMAKATLVTDMFNFEDCKKNKERNAIARLMDDEDFLRGSDKWSYAGGIVSLNE